MALKAKFLSQNRSLILFQRLRTGIKRKSVSCQIDFWEFFSPKSIQQGGLWTKETQLWIYSNLPKLNLMVKTPLNDSKTFSVLEEIASSRTMSLALDWIRSFLTIFSQLSKNFQWARVVPWCQFWRDVTKNHDSFFLFSENLTVFTPWAAHSDQWCVPKWHEKSTFETFGRCDNKLRTQSNWTTISCQPREAYETLETHLCRRK